jgi:hypothetical protein
MKNLLTALFLTVAITCFAGVNPVLQNPYTTNNQAAADAHVTAIAGNGGLSNNTYTTSSQTVADNYVKNLVGTLTNSSGVIFTNIQFQFTNRLNGGGFPVYYTNHWASYIQIQGLVATLTGNDYNNAGIVTYGVTGRWAKTNSVQAAAITGGTINIDTIPTFGVYTNEVFWFGAPSGAYGVIQYAGEIQWVIGGGGGGGSSYVLTTNALAALAQPLPVNISGSAATAGYATISGSAATAMSLSKVYSGINVAFVDCINGSNSVAQLGNETYPFRDFSNAVAAIASGGVVVLTPGQSNLIGSLVSISNDITIIGCGAWVVNTNTSDSSIFDVKGFNTVFTIIGGAYMSMGGNSYGTQLGVDSTNGDIKLYNANFFGVTDGMQFGGRSNHVYAVGCDCESYWDTSSGGNPTDSGLFQSCKFHSKADPAHSNPNGTELDCVSYSGGSWKYQACDFWSSNAVTINFGILNGGATIELDNCSLEIGSTNSGAAILLFYSPLPPAGAITIFNNSTVNGQLYNGTYVDGFLTNTGVPSILSPVMSPNVTSFAGTFYSLTISGSTNASVNIAPYLPGPSFGHPNVYVWTNSAGICVVSNDPGASGFYIVERTNDINQQTGNVLLVSTIQQASTPPWGNLSDYTDAASDTNVFIFPSALQYIPACSVGTNFTGNGSGLTNITSLSTVTGIHYVSSLTFSNILTGYMLGTNALNQPVMWAVSTNIITY